MMPGGTKEAYSHIKDIVEKVAAQVNDGPCVTYIGPGGAGNFVKMVHNGIEYGDMQLISEAYDVLKTLGGLTNEELNAAFNDWNKVGRRLRARFLPGCSHSKQTAPSGKKGCSFCSLTCCVIPLASRGYNNAQGSSGSLL